jgi:hypothetical protein
VQAQSGAPQVDPESPAGTEYELPLDRAREKAGGGTRGGTTAGDGGSGEAPLFGEGVEREDRAGAGGTATDGTTQTASSSRSRNGEASTATPATVRAQAPSPDGGGSGLLAVAAGAGGVLVLGGLAGVLWRRRSMGG